jgi:hypothetical protein
MDRSAVKSGSQDLAALREQALQETARYFSERGGVAPSDDSEEWEDQYRRQFELVKKRYAAVPAAAQSAPAISLSENEQAQWPELRGDPTQLRWAAALRAERMNQIRDKDIRRYLVVAWTSAKGWIEQRDQPLPVFLKRIEAPYAAFRKEAGKRAEAEKERRQADAAAAEAIRKTAQKAGVTAAGAVELIDVSPRVAALPFRAKLAEVAIEGRRLRVFETDDAAALMVIEDSRTGKVEYGIERDEGLVKDLKLLEKLRSPPQA